MKANKKPCIVWGVVFKGDTDPIHYYNGICVYPSKKIAQSKLKEWGGKKFVMVKKFLIIPVTK